MARIPLPFQSEDEIRWFPEDYVYIPVSTHPISPRERVSVWISAWLIACLIHVALFNAAGYLVDFRNAAQLELQMAWSNDPLTGFGMMDVYEPEEEAYYEAPPDVDPELDPFNEEAAEGAKPNLDPDSIVIPEPEPEPEIVENTASDVPPEQKPEEKKAPSHDLKQHPEKLNAVRRDVDTMPDLHVLAPGNARLVVLIRNDRVRGSRFENAIRRLFRAFPDYRFALGSSAIDPVNDIHAMLIATANPALYAETFLLVSHNIPQDKLKTYISQSFPTKIDWSTYNNHPIAIPDSSDGKYHPRSGLYQRSIYLPDEQTVLFLRPEVLPTLDVAHVDAIVQARDEELGENPAQAQTFLQALGSVGSCDSDSMPTLFFMLQGIENLSFGPNFPQFDPPVAVQGSMSTADAPHVNLAGTFETPEKAQRFVDLWPDLKKAVSGIGIPGVGGLVDALSLTNEENRVLITGDLNGLMVTLILGFAANHLESNNR